MSRTMRFLVTVAIFLAFSGESSAHTVITRISDRQNLTLPQLAAAAGSSDLILIGEAHDNKNHHDMQLELIRTLQARKLQLAIGLEMIQADSQQRLDEWSGGRIDEQTMQAIFAQNWSPDWEMYRDIFIFARDNQIPMIALNVPTEIVKKVSRQGFASLTPEERRDLPAGTSCDLHNPQIALLKRAFQGVPLHGNSGRTFTYFCEAQTVRNSGMALNLARYLKKHPERKVVGLTGIWHAVKYAIPDQLERNGSKLSYTVILPATPELSTESTTSSEADYMVDM